MAACEISSVSRADGVVADLSEKHRQSIELEFFADLKLDNIAASINIPLGTNME